MSASLQDEFLSYRSRSPCQRQVGGDNARGCYGVVENDIHANNRSTSFAIRLGGRAGQPPPQLQSSKT